MKVKNHIMSRFVTIIFAILINWSQASPTEYLVKPIFDGRIVGGFPIDINDVPYQISLQTFGHICGGSIISSKWVLTAAHCTVGQLPSKMKIRVGSSTHNKDGELFNLTNIIVHENFTYSTIDYDFSLLELQQEIVFNKYKAPIDLPYQNENSPDGSICRVSGWGNTQNAGDDRLYLRAADVPIVNQKSCNEAYASYGGVTDRMICAGYEAGGKDACQGDSGGPLVNNGKLIGVVSWGYGCARPHYPGVYSRVASVRNWISKHTGL